MPSTGPVTFAGDALLFLVHSQPDSGEWDLNPRENGIQTQVCEASKPTLICSQRCTHSLCATERSTSRNVSEWHSAV